MSETNTDRYVIARAQGVLVRHQMACWDGNVAECECGEVSTAQAGQAAVDAHAHHQARELWHAGLL